MFTENKRFPRISPVGERALVVCFADNLTIKANQQVRALDRQMSRLPLAGVIEWIPAYASLLVLYDPMRVPLAVVQDWLESCLLDLSMEDAPPVKRVAISVRYGGADGPDLPFVAEYHRLTPADVVEIHAQRVYQVAMMGFMPGFAYLLGLDPVLATPRLETPRTHVPAGSVGIAGEQTGIYPLDSPGGWQLIGRTDQVLFDPSNAPYFSLSPGDEVCFVPAKDSFLP
jgi:KipI family sensor histidine kinase inhibitor